MISIIEARPYSCLDSIIFKLASEKLKAGFTVASNLPVLQNSPGIISADWQSAAEIPCFRHSQPGLMIVQLPFLSSDYELLKFLTSSRPMGWDVWLDDASCSDLSFLPHLIQGKIFVRRIFRCHAYDFYCVSVNSRWRSFFEKN